MPLVETFLAGLGSFIAELPAGLATEVLGSVADKLTVGAYEKLRDRWTMDRPVENPELQKAVLRSYLQATLIVCKQRKDDCGGGGFINPLLHEIKYLERIHADFVAHVKAVERGDFRFPSIDSVGKLPEALVLPDGAERLEFRQTATARALEHLSGMYADLSDEFRDLFTRHWYACFCACFQHQLKTNQPLANLFIGNLLAGLTVLTEQALNQAVTQDFVESAFGKLGIDLSGRFADVERLLAEGFADVLDAVHDDGERTRREFRDRISSLSAGLRGFERREPEKPEPVIILTPTGQHTIVDRDDECAALLRELKKSRRNARRPHRRAGRIRENGARHENAPRRDRRRTLDRPGRSRPVAA